MSDFPRRIQMQQWVPAERMISDAMHQVESMGADLRLTDAVDLLGKAKDRVADFVDGVKAAPSVPQETEVRNLLERARILLHEQGKHWGDTSDIKQLRDEISAWLRLAVPASPGDGARKQAGAVAITAGNDTRDTSRVAPGQATASTSPAGDGAPETGWVLVIDLPAVGLGYWNGETYPPDNQQGDPVRPKV